MTKEVKTLTLAITGASGSVYALNLLERLLEYGINVHLLVSDAAELVMKTELGKAGNRMLGLKHPNLNVHTNTDWLAAPASGSSLIDAMVVCPCSMGTLSAIANGASDSLIERASDVMIKESRKLILVPRETPLSAIHLENMLSLAKLGVIIMPASPGFYHQPQTVEDLSNFMVARILDNLSIKHNLRRRWGE